MDNAPNGPPLILGLSVWTDSPNSLDMANVFGPIFD